MSHIKEKCRAFYQLLRDKLPNSCIIAAQVEARFHERENRFDGPLVEDFKLVRRYLNRYIHSLRCKDFLFRVEGPGRLDNRILYIDSVHLNALGLDHLSKLITDCLSYCSRKIKSE